MSNDARIRVADRNGRILADLPADIKSVSWEVSRADQADLWISKNDERATEPNLRVGNRVFIEFSNGLPDWGGFIGLPRTWSSSGYINLKCYGPESRLNTRYTAKRDVHFLETVGDMYERLIRREEEKDTLGITIGHIWMGGNQHTKIFNLQKVLDVIDGELRALQVFDSLFTAYLSDGRIYFRADLYQQAGSDKTQTVTLLEGKNVRVEDFVETGTLINKHYAAGGGTEWIDRPVMTAVNQGSISLYGLRESAQIYEGTSLQASLVLNSQTVIEDRSEPKVLFSLYATDDEPGRFKDYTLGDKLRCVLPSYGFGGYDGEARVMSITYKPSTGESQLVLEEPADITYAISEDDLDVEY